MAVAGYLLVVRKSGTSTGITSEACSLIGSGSVAFQITTGARRCIDPETVWNLKDGVTTVPYTNIASVDLLNGQFTLTTAASGALTFNGSFLPLTTASNFIAEAKSFNLNQSSNLLDTTVFTATVTSLTHARIAGLKDVDLSVESVASQAQLDDLQTIHEASGSVALEIYFGSNAVPRFRGICKIESIERSASVDDLLTSNLTFKIAAVNDSIANVVTSYAYKTQF